MSRKVAEHWNREVIEHWKEFHRELSDALGCKFLTCGVTLERAKEVMQDNQQLRQRVAELEQALRDTAGKLRYSDHEFYKRLLGDASSRDVTGLTGLHDDCDWIEWGGGEMPVDGETLVYVKYASGKQSSLEMPAGGYRWQHLNSHCDIIAYRVVDGIAREGVRDE